MRTEDKINEYIKENFQRKIRNPDMMSLGDYLNRKLLKNKVPSYNNRTIAIKLFKGRRPDDDLILFLNSDGTWFLRGNEESIAR